MGGRKKGIRGDLSEGRGYIDESDPDPQRSFVDLDSANDGARCRESD